MDHEVEYQIFNSSNRNLQEWDEDSHSNISGCANEDFSKLFESQHRLYGLSFQTNKSKIRAAVSSLEVEKDNYMEVIEYDTISDKMRKTASIQVEYPPTKVMWSPSYNSNNVLATSSDVLRLYKYNETSGKLNLACSLTKQKCQNYSGPLTSMDWNKENPSIIAVCSIDTTCAIWDLTKNEVKTLLIAHDKEVYDICFGKDENVFLTTGADGSVRLFDTRALDSSFVLFESLDNSPITRISWNLNDENFVAALGLDKNIIYIIDKRNSNSPYAFLNYHTNVVNAITWAPHSNANICSVGDDKSALIWDIQLISNKSEDPIMSYSANFEIENVSWSESNDEWIGINGANTLQLLKVK